MDVVLVNWVEPGTSEAPAWDMAVCVGWPSKDHPTRNRSLIVHIEIFEEPKQSSRASTHNSLAGDPVRHSG
jgi:hypothetical protein